MKSWQQNLIPQKALSHLMGKLANAKWGCVTRYGIKKFIDHYQVNLSEAKISDYTQFATFNDFFTRELKLNARTIVQEKNVIVSPVDGSVSECGFIQEDQLLQAKGAYFSLKDLCGGDVKLATQFHNGAFLTAYLSPKDYHRFHMPFKGRLKKMIYVPGKLFSVNASSVKNVPGLFARNERVICIFETEIGEMALIAVGAMIVGSISMHWHGVVASEKKKQITTWEYQDQSLLFQRGDEVGHFRLGSTVILLFEHNKVNLDFDLLAGKSLQLGESIARLRG
ncbi:MAG: phosphatidylserine decarboxylase [Gammaproteobacteria bacterium CG_4_10_14_0_8_um_filter_38_16]|nr:MAG: phosphatidylserine decarboxylase [Gammaproteobacteria bacterium CG_4_10_14_0_8_um_filter_38_16]PJA03148.1 MAG: phosphatidylserine decarboxylase [Gammaproteobacteria bacterium CG_4_10_14_0_2_um_filter_38_22]PJB10531.1 MAG: phosphatidylserine decarboxylase [Gammaproteobacteria bacterium CG_4_9_14_3_um_filter_38_9]